MTQKDWEYNMNRADRNNNPTNIKVPKGGLAVAKQRYGDANVSIDPTPASDGGYFLKFSTPEKGFQATSTLLKDPLYQDMTVDTAMSTWSGGGYGGDVAGTLSHKTISELTPEEMKILTQNMAKREGYTGKQSQGLLSQAFGIPTANAQTSDIPKKMSLQEFGDLYKKTHPAYADRDSTLLGQAVLRKRPIYADRVDTGEKAQESQQETLTQPQKITQQVAGLTGFPKIAATVKGIGQEGLSLGEGILSKVAGSIPGQEKLASEMKAKGDVNDLKYQKAQTEGYDFGPYIGKTKPISSVPDALGTGLKAGVGTAAIGHPGLLATGLWKLGKAASWVEALRGGQDIKGLLGR